MSKTITIELADEVYQALAEMSRKTGRSVEVLALEWLTRHGSQSVVPRSEEERKAARSKLLKFAGIHRGADSHGSDNDRIDVDLADEYEGSDGPGSAGN